MTNLPVVPLQDINPLPDAGVDACLIWEMDRAECGPSESPQSGILAKVLPLGYAHTMPSSSRS